jgi:formylglycine-generating enzyme required for sulfatase activity
MPQTRVQLEDLLALAEALRKANYGISTQHYIRAHSLLDALAAEGKLPADPRAWQTLLGPVFCSSQREQQEFPQHFKAWLQRRPSLQAAVEELEPLAEPLAPQPTPSADWRAVVAAWLRTGWLWFKRPAVLAATGSVLLLTGSGLYLARPVERHLKGQVLSSEKNLPLPNAEVSFAQQRSTTDNNGAFDVRYTIRNLDRLWQRKADKWAATHLTHQDGIAPSPIPLHAPPAELPPIVLQKLAPMPTPTPGPRVELPTVDIIIPPPVIKPRYWWPALIPLLLYAAWLVCRWLWRKLILQRMQSSRPPQLRHLKLATEAAPLFNSPVFQRALIELRRHRQFASPELDAAATVRETIRQGGFFTPKFGRRRTLPDYLLLIDRASLQDEQARVGEELAARLKASDIGVEWYFFQGDARACRGVGTTAPTVTLHELAARHPDQRLLVFGDGAEFFDPGSGAPQRWLEQFEVWPERALITPVPPAQWGYREDALAAHDFLTLPASDEGFEILTAWLNTGLNPVWSTGLLDAGHQQPQTPFPEVIAEQPKRWVERVPPQPKAATQLDEQVQQYLGPRGWRWLAACAVYPQLTWELTLYLGARLFNLGQPAAPAVLAERQTEWTEQLLRLLRLPWFRYGTLPDWWRTTLLATFTAQEEAEVRDWLITVLHHVLTKPDEPLEIASAAPPPVKGWQRLLARLRLWYRLQQVFNWLRRQPENSPLRDYVFLNFLAGRRPQRLAVQAPSFWRRLLFVAGQRELGWQPLTLGVLALSTAALLWWVFWFRPITTGSEPKWENVPPPLATPTLDPNAPLRQPSPSPTAQPKTAPTAAPAPSAGGAGSGEAPGPIEAKGEWPVVKIEGGYRVEMPNGVTLDLVSVAGGEFLMGIDNGLTPNKSPAHRVRLSGFNLGKYEVTQEQWLAVMGGKNPSNFQGDKLPVEQVSWTEAREFCQRLTAKTGVPFDLPTVAQWEYAARAGWPGEYGFNGDAKQLGLYAWYDENSDTKTHLVGQKQPNRWGLYDMHGNVSEWCRDWYDANDYAAQQKQGTMVNPTGPARGDYRHLRGGSWADNRVFVQAVVGGISVPGDRDDRLGFRVVVGGPPSLKN